ncbi:Reverse transcriptase domain [Trinorchestia longiramus]|nr:Reverse transcriptase domain [Trinorchestia longiramus]
MSSNNTKQSTPYNKLNDTYYHSPSDKEPLFRTHWSNIYSGTDDPDSNFDDNHIHDVETQMTNITPHLKPHETGDVTRLNTPQFPAITLQELKQALQTFSQKAPGHTKITTHHLKQLPPNMLQYLLYIFNNAISAGYFPTKLKHAIMIFLPKPSTSQHEIKNYRPISLLDTHGKLLDKILTYRLTDHFTIHNIHNKRQHGFRHGRGTHTALATLHETLHIHLNQRHTIDVILRDVSKAFDKVWHTDLKFKLSQLNLHPLIFNVPASCLPSPNLTPHPAKAEDQQLRYFLQKDKITSFDAFKPERNMQKQYKNLIISRSKETLVCLLMTDNFSECSLSVIVENKPTNANDLCSPLTLSAFKNGISTTV